MDLKDAEYYEIDDETVVVTTPDSTPDNHTREKKKAGNAFFIMGFILFLLAATVLAVVILYVGSAAMRSDKGTEAKITYTAEEVAKIITDTEEVTMASTEQRVKDEMNEQFLRAAKTDSGILNLLRDTYPDQIIYLYGTKYEFYPIDQSLKKNTIDNSCLVNNDDGTISYVVDGKTKSHIMVDVSSFQGDIDWEKVAEQGVEYAMIRCAFRGYESGKIVEDKTFAKNVEGATAAGIKVGVYFFTQALNKEEAYEEADFALELIRDYKVTLPVAIDVEDVSGSARTDILSIDETTDNCVYFMERVKEAGYSTMIYSNSKFFIKRLNITKLEGYDKWYAFYNDTIYFPYEIAAWQYTSSGYVEGIGSGVDLDITFKEW